MKTRFSSTTPAASGGESNVQFVEQVIGGIRYIAGHVTSGVGVSVNTRANLPGSVPASGSMYICTNSPYSYVSNGADWLAFLQGQRVTEPDGLTLIKGSASPPTETLDQTAGGYFFSATGSGDQVVSYVKAVTPSSTLRVAIGFQARNSVQGGFVIYNQNTNKVYFFRTVSNVGYNFTLFRTIYTADGGTISTNTSIGSIDRQLWRGCFALRFDATTFYIEWLPDTQGVLTAQSIYSEALATNIGTDFTHIGFGVNIGGGWCWGQHLQVLSA